MPDIHHIFAKRVKETRLRKHLSQGDLAKTLGVHPSYVSGIERGIRNMTLSNLDRLARSLGVPITELLQ